MLLEVLTFLVFISVVVSSLLLARFISASTKKDRELSRVRDERIFLVIKQIERSVLQVIKTEKRIEDRQSALDGAVDKTTKLIDEQKAAVQGHLLRFDVLAKSDMMTARRDELLRTKELKVALERLVGVSTLSRQPPSVNDMVAIDSLTSRIKELETILDLGNEGR